MPYRETWILIYLSFAALIVIFGALLVYIGRMNLRGRVGDINYIDSYMNSVDSKSYRIKRVSNFTRIISGGIFQISNIARIYKVECDSNGIEKSLLFSFDELTGEVKLRQHSVWKTI